MTEWLHPTGKTPTSVDVVALGPTSRLWQQRQLLKSQIRQQDIADEVWTVNRGIRSYRHDLAFVMDDLELESHDDPDYGLALEQHDKPIITSTRYGQYPSGIAYPLGYVLRTVNIRRSYMHNSIPYVLAYALAIGVRKIVLWGCDYTYPGMPAREDDRANCEYWVGVCEARGMTVLCPADSTLLNSRVHDDVWFYGYSLQPRATWNTYIESIKAGPST